MTLSIRPIPGSSTSKDYSTWELVRNDGPAVATFFQTVNGWASTLDGQVSQDEERAVDNFRAALRSGCLITGSEPHGVCSLCFCPLSRLAKTLSNGNFECSECHREIALFR